MLELYNAQLSKSNLTVIEELFDSGNLASGIYENKLKDKIKRELCCDNISIISNYSLSIYLALKVIGVEAGDNVICKSFNCLNSTSPVLMLKANIVWADLEENSTDVCLQDLEEKIKLTRPKVFVNYNISGYVDRVYAINELCAKYGVKVIQDCNALFYSYIASENIAGKSDFTVYSLYPNRLVNSIDGGVLVCQNPNDSLLVDRFKKLGIPQTGFRNSLGEININCDISEAGINAVNSNVSNAIAINSIREAPKKLLILEQNIKTLISKLGNKKSISLVKHNLFNEFKYCWNFLILVENKEYFIKLAKERGISVSGMHINNHLYSCFSGAGSLPNTENFYSKVLAIPCGWWLSEYEIDYIANNIIDISNIVGKKNV